MITREKITLGFCAAASLAAFLFYTIGLSGGPANYSVAVERDITTLVIKAKESLDKAELTDREERVLELAVRQSLRDPLRSKPVQFSGDDPTPELLLPSYIGFIDTGSEPIAIIDGLDYRVGELISGGEFEVSRIAADHVRLLRLGATDTFEVLIEKPQVP